MKKILLTLLTVIICIALVGCGKRNDEEKDAVEKQPLENVSMVIKEGTLSRTEATVIITDTNETPYEYGMPFRIERKENVKWKELKASENAGFNLPSYHVDENNQLELRQNWDYIYGTLEDGVYRLVKDVCVSYGCREKKEFFVEFAIGKEEVTINEVNEFVKKKIVDTKKIEVYNDLQDGDVKIKSITEDEEVKNIVTLLYHVKERTYTGAVAGIGPAGYFILYDSNDKVLATIYIGKGYIELDEKDYLRDTTSLIEMFQE